VKYGKSTAGKQGYCCRDSNSQRCSFLEFTDRGYLPQVKQQVSEMAINGSGITDTARVLKISPTTVIETLKKVAPPYSQVFSSLSLS
jgi:transposase-like protein